MDDPPLIGLHRVHHEPLSGAADALRQPERHLLDGFLSPVAIVLDVDHQASSVAAALIQNQVDHGLEGAERFATPSDQQPEIFPADVDHHGVVRLADVDLGQDAHFEQQVGHHLPGFAGVGVAQRDTDPGLLGLLVEHLDLDVLPGLFQVLERFLDGFVDGLAACLHAGAGHAALAPPLRMAGMVKDPHPVMKYCWPIENRLLTTQ